MTTIEQRLQELGREPIPHVDPSASVGRVVRRGRLRAWVARGVTATMVLTSGVAAAAVAPQVLDRTPTPTVAGEVDGIAIDPVEDPTDDPAPAVTDDAPSEPSPSPSPEESDGSQVVADTTPPTIAVTGPADGSTSEERTIAFTGEVEPGAKVLAGPYEAKVTDDGTWSIVLVLSKGKNVVEFVAEDAAGNRATASVTVHYEPVVTDAPTTSFTASQAWDAKTNDPPYGYYEGTAQPGSVIKVTSEYGSAAAEADAKGRWATKVWFTSAPVGTHTWKVTATSKATGESKSFSFTGTRPEAKDLQLDANQKHASVAGDPPVNTYWGTATPGEKVKVYSDYGWASTVAAKDGTWKLDVTFTDAPAGVTTFTVVAKLWDHPEVNESFTLTTERSGGTATAFTVEWAYESSSEDPPYQDASGTAPAGSTVYLLAETGDQAVITVGSDGTWSGRLVLNGAVRGETAYYELKAKSEATGEKILFPDFRTDRPA